MPVGKKPNDPPPSEALQIDFLQLDYPSDVLTLKDLRRLIPMGFKTGDIVPNEVALLRPHVIRDNDTRIEEFRTMLEFERLLARHAFDAALGRKPETCLTPRNDVRHFLKELYVTYELAEGPAQARELVRTLEKAAAEQAQRWSPPGAARLRP
jgi:hypothetical protein